ncbi:MAG TPA: hypothetical protein PK013_05435, partial [Thermosynergistes sp.]|nr:hypothetical protein [Thermosynergistes sp.]
VRGIDIKRSAIPSGKILQVHSIPVELSALSRKISPKCGARFNQPRSPPFKFNRTTIKLL